jgi:LPXTG-site transpeptidase (sortase) family protein
MKMKAIFEKTLADIIAVTLIAAMTLTPALAADYDFSAKSSDDFYTPTPYEEVYGSEYIYGGVNAVDMSAASVLPGIFTPPEYSVYSGGYSVDYATNYSGYYGTEYMADGGSDFTVVTSPEYIAQNISAAPFTSAGTLTRADGSVGTLEIPSLGISVKAYSGTGSDSLSKGVGHFPESSGWDGNVGLAGHNRGAKYSIGAIKDLVIGDTIKYTTALGTRTYSVNFVRYISSGDWSYLSPMADNRITVITCLAGKPDLRVCVQAVEMI